MKKVKEEEEEENIPFQIDILIVTGLNHMQKTKTKLLCEEIN